MHIDSGVPSLSSLLLIWTTFEIDNVEACIFEMNSTNLNVF